MKSSAYWKKRFEQIEQAANNQGVQCYADIEKQYRQAQKQIESQISVWYQRFAKNNNVTLTEAKRMLNAKELAELKWDVNQYIQYGEENAINGTWVKQLENASARFHISRLEALKLQTQQSIEVLFGNQLDSIDGAMRSIYTSGYYRTAFELQKGVGVGWDFATLDDKTISKVINKRQSHISSFSFIFFSASFTSSSVRNTVLPSSGIKSYSNLHSTISYDLQFWHALMLSFVHAL